MTGWVGAHAGASSRRPGDGPWSGEGLAEVTDDLAILAVASGVGDPRVRGKRGARFAVLSAREALLARHPPEVLPDRLVEAWRLRVWGDLGDHSPSGVEQRRADPPFTTLYAATLVAASVAGETLTLLQIGSGDLLLGSGRGSRVHRPFLRPQRHYALGDGHSLSDQYAAAHVRIRTVDLGRVELDVVLLSTPGMDAAHADGRYDAATVADLVEDLRGRTGPDLTEAMEHLCVQRPDVCGERRTVALLVRDDLLTTGRRGVRGH